MATPAEVLGRGIELEGNFDVAEQAGSVPVTSGIDILERDTAFALTQELDVFRGELSDDDFAAEVELATRRVLDRDDRIASIGSISVDLDAGPTTVTIEAELTAADTETTELIVEP